MRVSQHKDKSECDKVNAVQKGREKKKKRTWWNAPVAKEKIVCLQLRKHQAHAVCPAVKAKCFKCKKTGHFS